MIENPYQGVNPPGHSALAGPFAPPHGGRKKVEPLDAGRGALALVDYCGFRFVIFDEKLPPAVQNRLLARVKSSRSINRFAIDQSLPNSSRTTQAIFLTPSPPAEKAATYQDQAGQSRTNDGARNAYRNISEYDSQVVVAEVPIRERLIRPRYEGPHRY